MLLPRLQQTHLDFVLRRLNLNVTNMWDVTQCSLVEIYQTVWQAHLSLSQHTRIVNNQFPQMGRDSSLGIATRYGLDSRRMESQWGTRISSAVQTGPGAHPVSCTMCTGSFPVGKASGTWLWTPMPSNTEVIERVKLHHYSTRVTSWPLLVWTLTGSTGKRHLIYSIRQSN